MKKKMQSDEYVVKEDKECEKDERMVENFKVKIERTFSVLWSKR